MQSGSAISAKDFEKALQVGRPPNVSRLFPHSRALLVSGKVIDRGMIAKGKAMTIAEKVSERPPIPVFMTKESINAHATALNHAASYMDADQFTLTTLAKDHVEGIAAFLEKRKPVFKGD